MPVKIPRKLINIIIIGNILFFVPLAAAINRSFAGTQEEDLLVANKAFEDGFYEVSRGLLEKFIKKYPDSERIPGVKLRIAQCYFYQNKFIDALTNLETLLNQPHPKEIEDATLYWIAEVHFRGDNLNKAAEYYRLVIDRFPDSGYLADSYYSLGWCLLQQEKYNDALGYFEIILNKYPRSEHARDAYLRILESLYALKDYSALREKARAYLKTYASDTDSLGYVYFYLAEAEYYLNNFNEALAFYSKIKSDKKDNSKIATFSKLGLGWAYLKLKKYDDSLEAFSGLKEDELDKKNLSVLLLGKAILMAESNRRIEARDAYDTLLKTASDPAVLVQAYLGKAEALYNLAEYREAIETYEEALNRFESYKSLDSQELLDKLHYNLAWVYLKRGEFKEAIKEFQKIVKTSDDKIIKISALCQIGDAYQDSGDYLKAQQAYDAILKDYPGSFYSDYVQYQLGLTMLKSSNYDGAILSFLTFRKNFKDSKLLDDAVYALGLAYFQKQEYALSRDTFKGFQAEFKDSPLRQNALYLLGSSLYNMGKYSEAIEAFKDITRLYSNDSELTQKAEYEIADCYYQMGNEKEAISRFRSLRSKYPSSNLTAEVMWWLGGYYYRRQDFDLARRYLTSLIRDFPKSELIIDSYYALGASYEEEGRHQEAVENYRKVMELTRSDLAGQAAVAIADIYTKEGKTSDALDEYKRLIVNYPNLKSAIYPKIADLYYKTGDYANAVDSYSASLNLVPIKEMYKIQFKLAESLQAQGRPDEAIEEYLKVAYLYPEDNNLEVKAFLRAAELYEGKEKFKEALSIYNKVVSLGVEEAKYANERMEALKKKRIR